MTLAEELYQLYPKKVGKDRALRTIAKVLKQKLDIEWLKERIIEFAASPAGRDGGLFPTYKAPYPSTWFNDGRFWDDPEAWYVKDYKELERQKLFGSEGMGLWKEQK